MRLHELRLQAFQAFAGAEVVDFDALSQAGLFLLHGDTGAGKTTLLDAVVFALYGDGAARSTPDRLRSDHAAPDVPTEVELELTVRGRRMRVWRRPAQERPKQRGDGLTRDTAKVRVQEREADGTWRTVTVAHDESRDELEAVLGLTREQFCQVVLLPQGAFAAFLRASSDDRRKVLETLFATERFTGAEDWLVRRCKATEHEFYAARDVVASLAARVAQAAGAEGPPEHSERDCSLIATWTAELAVPAAAEVLTARGALDEATRTEETTRAALVAARALDVRRTKAEAARDELAGWQAGRERRDEAERALDAATRAAGFDTLLAEIAERRGDLDAARAAVTAARSALGSGLAEPEPTPAAPDALQLFGDPPPLQPDAGDEPARLRRRADALREAAGAVAAFAEVEAALRGAEHRRSEQLRSVVRADEALAVANGRLADLPARRREAQARLAEAGSAVATVMGAEREAAAATARAQDATERDRLAPLLREAEREVAARQAAELDLKAAWLSLRERRLAGMAADLAATLVPGEACTVCGATEHPDPAERDDDGAVDAEQERGAQERHEAAAEARGAAETVLSELRTRSSTVRGRVGETPRGEVQAAARAAHERHVATATLAATLESAEAAVAALADEEARLVDAARTAAETLASAQTAADGLKDTIETDRGRLLAALAGAPDVATRQAALVDAAAAHAALADALERRGRAEGEAADAERRVIAAATRAGFADLPAAQAALTGPEDRATLTAEISAWDTGLAERRAAVKDPEHVAALAAPAPDVTAVEHAAQTATSEKAVAERTLALAADRAAALERLHAEVVVAVAATIPVAERLEVVRGLARLADGSDASNRLKMRLSAYVLAARLEEVAAAATIRLRAMTDGRYELVHCDETAGRARRGGLDLRVVDAWTGTERPTQTLSGGETFKASLALALGLADVVTAESGGARLETLFVDEGFGSLDENSLEEVMDVLDRLRDGGRAVGVVSHVADLRDRIHARLHVVRGREGSTVRALLAA